MSDRKGIIASVHLREEHEELWRLLRDYFEKTEDRSERTRSVAITSIPTRARESSELRNDTPQYTPTAEAFGAENS